LSSKRQDVVVEKRARVQKTRVLQVFNVLLLFAKAFGIALNMMLLSMMMQHGAADQ